MNLCIYDERSNRITRIIKKKWTEKKIKFCCSSSLSQYFIGHICTTNVYDTVISEQMNNERHIRTHTHTHLKQNGIYWSVTTHCITHAPRHTHSMQLDLLGFRFLFFVFFIQLFLSHSLSLFLSLFYRSLVYCIYASCVFQSRIKIAIAQNKSRFFRWLNV